MRSQNLISQFFIKSTKRKKKKKNFWLDKFHIHFLFLHICAPFKDYKFHQVCYFKKFGLVTSCRQICLQSLTKLGLVVSCR